MNVEPAPFSWPSPFVQRYESAVAEAGAEESAGADAEAVVLGSLEAVAAAEEDGARVPPPQADATMATSRPNAARRFPGVITFNASSIAPRALSSMAPQGTEIRERTWPRNLLPPPRSARTVNVHFLAG